MASLLDFNFVTEDVLVGGQSLTVRGISFDDVSLLISRHREALETAISSVAQAGGDTGAILAPLIQQLPELAAQVIACATDAPELAEKARKLPVTAQLDVLLAVGRLTFEEAGGVKKFAEQLADLFRGIKQSLPTP